MSLSTLLVHPVTLLILPLTLLFLFLHRLFHERARYRSLPGPPHHWLLGHIPAFISIVTENPPNLFFLALHPLLSRKHNLTHLPCFYLDLWPLASAACVIQSGAVAAQITQANSLPKDPEIYTFVQAFAGKESLAPMRDDGPDSVWKFWRGVFNPGFSPAHLLTLTPMIIDKALIFTEKLAEHARKGDVVPLETLTSALTVDIIGKVVMGADFDTQRGRSEMVETLKMIPKFVLKPGTFNPLVLYNPLRIWRHRYYERRTDRMIGEMLDERFERRLRESRKGEEKERARQVVDLALEAYDKEMGTQGKISTKELMDPEFRRIAIANIRGFLFAGHDTTSSTLCYIYHLLSTHPSTLQLIRSEHDALFTRDTTRAATLITADPHLLMRMPYTSAVINETMRLYPLAGTIRLGQPGFVLSDPETGATYPTHDSAPFSLTLGGFAIHRLPSNFPDPDSFDPGRFLPRSQDGSLEDMPKDAFRPFEKGKRNCIGLELANLEMRVVLALTVRGFDVNAAYGTEGPLALGDRAYPTLDVVAKPVDGLPVKIRVAGRG
jgi:cytochrome P450